MAKVVASSDGKTMFVFCPGCGHAHGFHVKRETSPNWAFNGDMNKPTFTPSMRTFVVENGQEVTLCHSFVTDGRIQLLDDSKGHEVRGWHDLPEFPTGYGIS